MSKIPSTQAADGLDCAPQHLDVLLVRPHNTTSMLIPNHGLGYLATALRRRNLSVAILDFIKSRTRVHAIPQLLASYSPVVIGLQVYTFDLPYLAQQLEAIRSAQPSAVIVAGGPHPSADPAGTLRQFPDIDFVLIGEAEHSFPQTVTAIKNHSKALPEELAAQIPGLAWRAEPDSIRCNRQEYILELDELGFPAWDLIDPRTYPHSPQGTFLRRIPYAPIIVTRGCPHQCTFCGGHVVNGRHLRTRSVGHVLDELELLIRDYRIREFHIQDDNFTHSRDYVLQFCQEMHQRGLDLLWSCPNGVRLDTLDREVLQAMERAGCYSIAVGIESGSQRILELMKKRLRLEEVRSQLTLIRKTTKLKVTGFFIIGYPDETLTEMKKTVRLAMELPLDKVNFGTLMPLPGTAVHTLLEDRGCLHGLDYRRMSEYRSPYTPAGLTPNQFRKFFRRAFITFYARPRIIASILGEIKSLDQVKVLLHRFADVVGS